jgi:WD40 repeat protein
MAILPDYTTIFTTCDNSFASWDLEAFGSIVETPQQSDRRRLDDGCPTKKVAISPSGRFMISLSKDEQSLSLWRLPEATFEKSLTVDQPLASYQWSFSQPSDISNNKEAFILLGNDIAHVWFLDGIEDTHIKYPSSMKLPIGDLCLGSISEQRKEITKLGG